LQSTGLLKQTNPLVMTLKLEMNKGDRAKHKMLYIELKESEDNSAAAFLANSDHDIPRKKVTEKLVCVI
jgi:hypothetical protein